MKINDLGQKRELAMNWQRIGNELAMNWQWYWQWYFEYIILSKVNIIFSQGEKLTAKGLSNFYFFCKLFIINNLLSFDGSKILKLMPYRGKFKKINCQFDCQSFANRLPIDCQSFANWQNSLNLFKTKNLIHFLTFLVTLYFYRGGYGKHSIT